MKDLLKRIPILVAATTLLVASSCYYDQREETLPGDIEVSFSADIQPIFNTHCTVCHPSINPTPDLTGSNSYNALIQGGYIDLDDSESSLLYQRLIGNPSVMPPSGGLPGTEINKVLSWIEQGAPNN